MVFYSKTVCGKYRDKLIPLHLIKTYANQHYTVGEYWVLLNWKVLIRQFLQTWKILVYKSVQLGNLAYPILSGCKLFRIKITFDFYRDYFVSRFSVYTIRSNNII